MYALVTTQGTAMAETALCDEHYSDPDVRDYALDRAANDWDGGPFIDCTGNDALTCVADH